MGRTKQGGSVLSFIIVGALLLGALAGGVYWYRRSVASRMTPEVATKPTSPSGTNDAARDKSNSGSSSQSSEQSKPSTTTPDASKTTPAQPAPARPAPAPQSTSQLPTTGPADTLAAMVALGALTAAAAAYGQSRRTLRSL